MLVLAVDDAPLCTISEIQLCGARGRKLFRRLFLEQLAKAHRQGRLRFFGELSELTEAEAFTAYLQPLRKIDWSHDPTARKPP